MEPYILCEITPHLEIQLPLETLLARIFKGEEKGYERQVFARVPTSE